MSKEQKIVEQKCPQCGSPMYFDPQKKRIVCDHCKYSEDIFANDVTEVGFEGFDFKSLNKQATDDSAENLPIYICQSCGAEVIAPPEQVALTCPYCRNNIVLSDKISGKMRPEGIIPFKVSSEELPAAMTEYYKNKKLLPKDFFSASRMEKITGVYVPFWIFSGELRGSLRYNATKTNSHRSGDYVVTNTDHYRLVRDVSVSFADLPVDASGKIDDALMDSLEPFDMKEEVPFDIRYLAGFTADRFDQGSVEIAPRAIKRMKATAEKEAQSNAVIGYATSKQTGGELKANVKARYILLPVYTFDISHRGEAYHFAVNGQTGKVMGNLPIDKGVKAAYFYKRAGIVAGIMMAWSIVKYFIWR
ncbi:MAG: hypothetical protein K6E19_00125 [Lachnospiraceae bacterium]|nr:hypothetical protein [Lachnospiraceae bacterium]